MTMMGSNHTHNKNSKEIMPNVGINFHVILSIKSSPILKMDSIEDTPCSL